jgi:hypothetical protein
MSDPPPAHRLFITDSPTETVWWHLGRFREVEETAKRLRDRHNKPDNAKKQAQQVRHCLEQAAEYFKAASSATLTTRPLLLYYGMASLAWTVVLFNRTGDYALDRLNPTHRTHGLEPPSLEYRQRMLPLVELLDQARATVPAKLNLSESGQPQLSGTFGLFYETIDHMPAFVNLVRESQPVSSTSRVPFPFVSKKPEASELAGKHLCLRELLFQIPDMAFTLATFGIRAPMVFCSELTIVLIKSLPQGSRRVRLAVSRATGEQMTLLKSQLPMDGATIDEAPSGFAYHRIIREDEALSFPYPMETTDGRLLLCLDDPPLPELAAFLAAYFVLGMLVRYHPHIWMNWVDRRHPLVDLVEALDRLTQRKFPNLILNALTGVHHAFRHP